MYSDPHLVWDEGEVPQMPVLWVRELTTMIQRATKLKDSGVGSPSCLEL